MPEASPKPPSPEEILRQEALATYRKFAERGATDPAELNSDDQK